jgi:hypothetical protein
MKETENVTNPNQLDLFAGIILTVEQQKQVDYYIDSANKSTKFQRNKNNDIKNIPIKNKRSRHMPTSTDSLPSHQWACRSLRPSTVLSLAPRQRLLHPMTEWSRRGRRWWRGGTRRRRQTGPRRPQPGKQGWHRRPPPNTMPTMDRQTPPAHHRHDDRLCRDKGLPHQTYRHPR